MGELPGDIPPLRPPHLRLHHQSSVTLLSLLHSQWFKRVDCIERERNRLHNTAAVADAIACPKAPSRECVLGNQN